MKYLLLIFSILIITGCNGSENAPDAPAQRRGKTKTQLAQRLISAQIKADAFGMIEFDVESIEQVNDTVYKLSHVFDNPMFNARVRVTRSYIIDPEYTKVISKEEVSTQGKFDGTWVDMGF